MMDLDIGLGTETEKSHKKKILIQYLWENLRFITFRIGNDFPLISFLNSIIGFSYHNWWAYRYYVCEFLSLVNVIGKRMFILF